MKTSALFLSMLLISASASQDLVSPENVRNMQTSAIAVAPSWKWVDCGESSDPVQLRSIVVSPDPPMPGENMTITVEAYVAEEIAIGAYAEVAVKIGVIKLPQQRYDMCEEARNANSTVQCPVDEGDKIVEQTVTLPNEIPKAKYVIQVRGFTIENENMLCADLFVDFTHKSSARFQEWLKLL